MSFCSLVTHASASMSNTTFLPLQFGHCTSYLIEFFTTVSVVSHAGIQYTAMALTLGAYDELRGQSFHDALTIVIVSYCDFDFHGGGSLASMVILYDYYTNRASTLLTVIVWRISPMVVVVNLAKILVWHKNNTLVHCCARVWSE